MHASRMIPTEGAVMIQVMSFILSHLGVSVGLWFRWMGGWVVWKMRRSRLHLPPYCTCTSSPPLPCASTVKLKKTTVTLDPGAWTRWCLSATHGIKRTHVTYQYLSLSTIVVTGH